MYSVLFDFLSYINRSVLCLKICLGKILTNNTIMLFGSVIQEQFYNMMWNQGAALSLMMLIIIGVTTLFTGKSSQAAEEGGII